jgi:hypothetical protein
MNIEFSENIEQNIKDLFHSLPLFYRKLHHKKQREIDKITIRIIDLDRFDCKVLDKTIIISQLAVEDIWALSYAYYHYFNFWTTKKADGKRRKIMGKGCTTAKKLLCWVKDNLKNNQKATFTSKNFPKYPTKNEEINIIFESALLFFIGHELFHILLKRNNPDIKEEKECDTNSILLLLNSLHSDDYQYIVRTKGVCVGLMYINLYGIYKKAYDGNTHPITYNRLIDNLSDFFGKENDKIWNFVAAMLALHLTDKSFVSEENNVNTDTPYKCVLAYRDILEKDNKKSII